MSLGDKMSNFSIQIDKHIQSLAKTNPYKAILYKIVIDACEDCVYQFDHKAQQDTYYSKRNAKARIDNAEYKRRSAISYIKSENFDVDCMILGINANYLRRKLELAN